MTTKTTVIYHKSDFDGIFCREIARKFLPDAELIGWEYGEPEPAVPPENLLYILDLSVPGLMEHPKLVWIDHHKSAIEKYEGPDDPEANLKIKERIAGYRIDGVAACRLAWQWLSEYERLGKEGGSSQPMPRKQAFIDRAVSEPWAVRLAGEYDIWDKRDPDAELFQHGLRSEELTDETWSRMLRVNSSLAIDYVNDLLCNGRILQYAKTQENESIIKELGFTIQWEGLTFLACNAARYNSFLFTAGIKPEHDALLGFKWTGKDWSVSLYHAPGKEHHDLSLIAVKHGGGGHKGACGFRAVTLPFLPEHGLREQALRKIKAAHTRYCRGEMTSENTVDEMEAIAVSVWQQEN